MTSNKANIELHDDWDDVQYVEHEEGSEWAEQLAKSAAVCTSSSFNKRLKAEVKKSLQKDTFGNRFKGSKLRHSLPANGSENENSIDQLLLNSLTGHEFITPLAANGSDKDQPTTNDTNGDDCLGQAQAEPAQLNIATATDANQSRELQATAAPTQHGRGLMSQLFADRPAHWGPPKISASKRRKSTGIISHTHVHTLSHSVLATPARGNTHAPPSTPHSMLTQRKRALPSDSSISFQPSWLTSPLTHTHTHTPVLTRTVDEIDVLSDREEDVSLQSRALFPPMAPASPFSASQLLSHSPNTSRSQQPCTPGSGGVKRNRRSRKPMGPLSSVLTRLRARLARDQAALRSGEFAMHDDASLDTHTYIDADPRRRAHTHMDVTIMLRINDDDSLANHTHGLNLVHFLAYLHHMHTKNDAFDKGFEGQEEICLQTPTFVRLIVSQNTVRACAMLRGRDMRLYDPIQVPAPTHTHTDTHTHTHTHIHTQLPPYEELPWLLCTQLCEPYPETLPMLPPAPSYPSPSPNPNPNTNPNPNPNPSRSFDTYNDTAKLPSA